MSIKELLEKGVDRSVSEKASQELLKWAKENLDGIDRVSYNLEKGVLRVCVGKFVVCAINFAIYKSVQDKTYDALIKRVQYFHSWINKNGEYLIYNEYITLYDGQLTDYLEFYIKECAVREKVK